MAYYVYRVNTFPRSMLFAVTDDSKFYITGWYINNPPVDMHTNHYKFYPVTAKEILTSIIGTDFVGMFDELDTTE